MHPFSIGITGGQQMTNDIEFYHTPVLLAECIDALNIQKDGVYVDATFGGGGHSREILKQLSDGKLFAFDCDEDAVINKIDDNRFRLIANNFRNLKKAILEYDITEIDGLLADLGVSSHQFDSQERGFSIRWDSKLDMRMNKQNGISAADVIRSYSEENLKNIFRQYGELRNASQIVRKIIANKNRIQTVNELKNAIAGLVPSGKENKFYAKVFQAFRIEVNDELNALKDLLLQSKDILKEGGRIVIVSYHSLEDRIVKTFFRSGKFEGDAETDIYGNRKTPFRVINKKPIVPDKDEMQKNNRARSAKLRTAEKRLMNNG